MSCESILVVSPEQSIYEGAKQLLGKSICGVQAVRSAEQALDLLAQDTFAVVVCDHILPGMSGAEFFENIKLRYPLAFRILLGEKSPGFQLVECLKRCEAHYFVSKPLDVGELTWAVERALEQRSYKIKCDTLISHLENMAEARAGEALAFERRYHVVFEQSNSIILLCRWDGSLLEVNRHGRNVLGISPNARLTQSIQDFLVSERFFHEVKQLLNQRGEARGSETAVCLPNGQELPIKVDAYALDDAIAGKVILCILTDLSEEADLQVRLNETQARFRATLDAISDPIFGVDRFKRVVSYNEALVSLVRTKKDEPVLGISCHDLLMKEKDGMCNEGAEKLGCPVERVLSDGETVSDLLHMALGSGEKRWWRRTFFPVFDMDGKPHQVVVVMRDVTEDVNAKERISGLNKELRQALAELTAKNQELSKTLSELKETQGYLLQSEKMASIGQLAAGVAHEINNPVGFISSNLHSLRDYAYDIADLLRLYEQAMEKAVQICPDSEELLELTRQITSQKEEIDIEFLLEDLNELIAQSMEGTDRVKKIIADLKDFSHVDRSELEHADINRGIESTLNIVWNELKYKASVHKNYGELPPLLCYPQQINQVFMNLLVNAAQAIKTKGEIFIETRTVNQPQSGIEVEIRDTGSGIPPEIMDKIFDPFFTTKPVGKGTGLGLNVSYKIVHAHRGEIRVESEVGRGTSFIVFLPFLDEEDFGDSASGDSEVPPVQDTRITPSIQHA